MSARVARRQPAAAISLLALPMAAAPCLRSSPRRSIFSESLRSTEFVAIQCPYCGERFETAVALSAGSFSYVEDCQVCCQPIELVGDVDDAGALAGVAANRAT